jgi:signal transduction histidine kinase
VDLLRRRLGDANVGLASFENLFRISPFPIMEQDYTQVEKWMDGLRQKGVTDIRQRLTDIDAVREVVPMIWIAAANPAAAEAVGLPIEDLIGPVDPRIVNDESYPSWISQFEAVWNRTPEAHTAFVAGTPDGRTYDAESTLSAPLVDGEPDFSRAMFTVVDVTEHRSEERRMEQLILSKSRFLASISHELRTPLTAILGFSQMLEDVAGDLSDEERRLMVSSIAEQAGEMSDLIDDLLVAARAETGDVNVEPRTIDVVEEINRTLTAGGSFTLHVRFDSTEETAKVMADPTRVRQILRNLLTNAEKYGGPDVAVSVHPSGEWVDIDVSDDGPGLPPDQWEPIFGLYHRAHGDEDQSLGIGLSVSRQLAELMAGSLVYCREEGRSVFRLRLPSA